MNIIAIASDHAGFQMKQSFLKQPLKGPLAWHDLGTSSEASVDYPDYAQAMAQCLGAGDASLGVLICGTGIGMSIAVNRFSHMRGALCTRPEMAKLARQHNDANVLILGARIMDEQTALQCLDVFLNTPFLAGRHQERLEKISLLNVTSSVNAAR